MNSKTYQFITTISLFFLFVSFNNPFINEWKLKKEVDGIKVYTKDVADSNLKELKIELDFENTTFSDIVNVINDSERYQEWLYKCQEAKTLEVPNRAVSIDYYQFDFPWPMADRELYSKSTFVQDPNTKNILIETSSLPTYADPHQKIVRIVDHFNAWKFSKNDAGTIHLEYFVKSDPAGNIPDWLVNMVIDRGPTNTLSALRKTIKENTKQYEQLDWIVE